MLTQNAVFLISSIAPLLQWLRSAPHSAKLRLNVNIRKFSDWMSTWKANIGNLVYVMTGIQKENTTNIDVALIFPCCCK